MLEERWDTRNVVTLQSSLLRDLRSAASVAKSRALALSSRIRISGFFTRARAMVSLCFWPPERFLPFCSSIKSSCPGLPSTTSFPCAVVSACHRSSSEASSRPHFRLSRIEPLKRAAFCGTTPILERRSLLV